MESTNFISVLLCVLVIKLSSCDKEIILTKCGLCDPSKDYPTKTDCSITVRNGIQYVSGYATLPIDHGDNILAQAEVFWIKDDNNALKLFSVNETVCKLGKKYMGPIFSSLEETVKIPPGTCPIPKGTYHVTDYPLDFKKLYIKAMLPSGKVNVTIINTEKATGKEILCYNIQLEIV